MAEKQGEIRTGEGGRKVLERRLAVVMASTLVTVSGHANLSKITVNRAATRADVEKDVASPANVCIKNPDSSLDLNFEQQLKEINDAINGSVPALNSVTNQELFVGKESITQARHVAIMEREERMHVRGLNVVDQAHPTTLGPQETLHKPMHVSEEISGLIQSGVNFSLGLSSPNQQKAPGSKEKQRWQPKEEQRK